MQVEHPSGHAPAAVDASPVLTPFQLRAITTARSIGLPDVAATLTLMVVGDDLDRFLAAAEQIKAAESAIPSNVVLGEG